MRNVLRFFLILQLVVLIGGCGSSNDSDPSSVARQGIFVDSPVAGLMYESSNHNGTTGNDGSFTYDDGDIIQFSVGNIVLGTGLAKYLMTPLDLVPGASSVTNPTVTNLVRFLMTLDDNAQPANGITITETMRTVASGGSINFCKPIEDFANDGDVLAIVSSVTSASTAGRRSLVSAIRAQSHLRAALAGIDDEQLSLLICDVPPCVFIQGVWSNQFEGVVSNFVEGGTAALPEGQPIRILMGTRDDGWAYVKADIKVIYSSMPSNDDLVVRIGRDPASLIGDSSMDPDSGLVEIRAPIKDADLVPDNYFVFAWLDKNKNDKIDNGEPYDRSLGMFTIVTPDQYLSHRYYLLVRSVGATLFTHVLQVPRAASFLRAFLLGGPVQWGGMYESSPIQFADIESALKGSLTYHVGIDYEDANRGTIRNFFFGPTSNLAMDIRSSERLIQAVNSRLSDANVVEAVWQQFQSGNVEITIPLTGLLSYVAAEGDQLPVVDTDLQFVFGTASFKDCSLTITVKCEDDRILPERIRIRGSVIDLYDFNYSEGCLTDGCRAALVQAGFGTLGDGGQIFRTEVKLDGELMQYSVDFGAGCSDLGPILTLSANPNPVQSNETTTISWTVSNATSCTASGDWSGSKSSAGGNETVNVGVSAGLRTYSMSCTGPGGIVSGSVDVAVTDQQPPLGKWQGNWVQVNFLGTDEEGNLEQWDEDSTHPEGIGFVAYISESEWVERDDYGNGCVARYSYSINGDRFSMIGKSTTCYFPGDFTEYTDSGRLEFPDNNTMIQWYDYPPGAKNEIVAFKWKRK